MRPASSCHSGRSTSCGWRASRSAASSAGSRARTTTSSTSAMRAMGVEALARQPLRSLSGGQQQRVYLAQVLARRADLIVLDEPTAGLDAGGRERYLQAFAAELERGATLVTSTHDIAEAVEYDQVLLLARPSGRPGPGPRGADGRPAARHVRDPPARPARGACPALRRRRGRPRRPPGDRRRAATRSPRSGCGRSVRGSVIRRPGSVLVVVDVVPSVAVVPVDVVDVVLVGDGRVSAAVLVHVHVSRVRDVPDEPLRVPRRRGHRGRGGRGRRAGSPRDPRAARWRARRSGRGRAGAPRSDDARRGRPSIPPACHGSPTQNNQTWRARQVLGAR